MGAQTKRVLRVCAVMQEHCVIKALDWVGECRSVCVGGGVYCVQNRPQNKQKRIHCVERLLHFISLVCCADGRID